MLQVHCKLQFYNNVTHPYIYMHMRVKTIKRVSTADTFNTSMCINKTKEKHQHMNLKHCGSIPVDLHRK